MNHGNSAVTNPDIQMLDEVSRAHLSKSGLLPSSWSINGGELKRIIETGLVIRVRENLPPTSWPANCIRTLVPTVELALDFVQSSDFSTAEKLATIFHEVGHLVNRPPVDAVNPESERGTMDMYLGGMQWLSGENPQLEREEYAADDYVRHLEMSEPLASAIKGLKKVSPTYFDNSMTTQRLARIERQDPLNLNLS